MAHSVYKRYKNKKIMLSFIKCIIPITKILKSKMNIMYNGFNPSMHGMMNKYMIN
jgi:hypothetical protein